MQMPPFETFKDAESFAATLAHELTHWTKHDKRLVLDIGRAKWGDEGYACEELVAELGSASWLRRNSQLCAALWTLDSIIS